jgi:hypothetical protein
MPVKALEAPEEITLSGITWHIEEATLDSAVMNNFVEGTQQIAARLVLTRKLPKPKPRPAVEQKGW